MKQTIIILFTEELKTKKLIESLGESENTEIIVSHTALKNEAIKKATGDWICLVNTNIKASLQDIEKIILITEKNQYLAGVPKLLNLDKVAQNNVGIFGLVGEDSFYKASISLANCQLVQEEKEIDLYIGPVALFHHTIFEKVGYFNEDFYLDSLSELDFCYKMYSKKLPLLYVPQVTLVHYQEL